MDNLDDVTKLFSIKSDNAAMGWSNVAKPPSGNVSSLERGLSRTGATRRKGCRVDLNLVMWKTQPLKYY